MGDGGKWVCGLEHIQKKERCVIYSFGEMRFLSPIPIEVLDLHFYADLAFQITF